MTPDKTSTDRPTVFVVDDDSALRKSLEVLLTALGYCVKSFAGGKEFLRHYQADMPGCLLLDVRMPDMGGLEVYERLQKEQKRLPVIFITAHADVPTAVAAMKFGAFEYLEKPFERAVLQSKVDGALAKDAELRTRENDFRTLEARITRLNERDRETLECILSGVTNKEIAAKLLLTERAVEMRRASLMKKLEVDSLAELIDLTSRYRLMVELRADRLR